MIHAYVGSRTSRERNARGEGISVFEVSSDEQHLKRIQLVDGLTNPSYLLLNRAGNRLYSVHGDEQHVSVFSVEPSTGLITLMQEQHCHGKNPVHLALDPTEQFLVVSNHWSSSLVVLPVNPDGAKEVFCAFTLWQTAIAVVEAVMDGNAFTVTELLTELLQVPLL